MKNDLYETQIKKAIVSMNTKHTPGPWHVVKNAGKHNDQVAILGPDDYYVSGTCGHYTSANAMANARLISSAPDLLDAVHSLAVALQHEAALENKGLTTASWDALAQARAAISKAEGRA